jgi:hypothetical protein
MYFFADGNRRNGPFSLDEMRRFPLRADTWVWREGLAAWTELVNVPELWAVFAERLAPTPAAAMQQFQAPDDPAVAQTPRITPLALSAIILGAVAFPAWLLPWSIFFVAPLALAAVGIGWSCYRRAKREQSDTFFPLTGFSLGAVNLAIALAIVGIIVFAALTSGPDADDSAAPATAPSVQD